MEINYISNFEISKQTSEELTSQFDFNKRQLNLCQSKIPKATETNEIYAMISDLLSYQSKILVRQRSNKPLEQQISYDNQTVISTSSVRRKDAKARDIVPMPT